MIIVKELKKIEILDIKSRAATLLNFYVHKNPNEYVYCHGRGKYTPKDICSKCDFREVVMGEEFCKAGE